MEILPNNGKNLIIEVDGRKFARYPVRTKLITLQDKDISIVVEAYVKKYLHPEDIVFVSEKAVAITQGRSYPINEVKASWLAQFLSKFVTKTPIGIGLGSPQTMQLAIEEVGVARILVASFIGAMGKMIGIKGWFYIVAGHGARSIDGAVSYALPPYNTYVSKGPMNANEVAEKISKKVGVPVAIVDANDFGVNILGLSGGTALAKTFANQSKKLIARIIKDNPLGQSDEQTPIGIIREVKEIHLVKSASLGEAVFSKAGQFDGVNIEKKFSSGVVRKAELQDLQNIAAIASLLHINIPGFVWDKPEYIARQITNGEYFVIDKNGSIVGIMSMRARNHKMHIETLVVDYEFQSKGLGTLFIEFAKQVSREKSFKTLHAYSFIDYNMVNFYLKKGFTKLSHSGYYNNHQYYCFEMKL